MGRAWFFYIYDHATQQVLEWNAIQPLARKTHVDEQPILTKVIFTKHRFKLKCNMPMVCAMYV
jgi:hypothetical protein